MDERQCLIPEIPWGGVQRYYSLDKLKTICSFLIVCIHAPFPGTIGEYIRAISRIAVPIFFMISGFFWDPEKSRRQIKKLFGLMISANLLYFLFDIVRAFVNHKIIAYFGSTFTTKTLIKFLLINESPFAPHLWYLGAVLYVQVVFGLLNRTQWFWKTLCCITPILLVTDLIFGKYSLLFLHREFPYIYLRNWLFVGIPYFSIGVFIRCNTQEIMRKVSLRLCVIGIGLFLATTVLERVILENNSLNASRDHYLSTTFLATTVFLLFLFYDRNSDGWLSRIGRNDSTMIYIIHYMILVVIGMMLNSTPIYGLYMTVRPFVVFIASIAFAELFFYLKENMCVYRKAGEK